MALSDALESVQNGISGLLADAKDFAGANSSAILGGAAAAGVVTGAVALGVAASKSKANKSRSKSKRRITHSKRGWKQDRRRFNKRQKWEVAYRKRKRKGKSRSRKGVHYTKNGQPYILLSSGKAKFIKGRRKK